MYIQIKLHDEQHTTEAGTLFLDRIETTGDSLTQMYDNAVIYANRPSRGANEAPWEEKTYPERRLLLGEFSEPDVKRFEAMIRGEIFELAAAYCEQQEGK